jgi:hypothetical protein
LTVRNTSANDSEVVPRRVSILILRITAANACLAGDGEHDTAVAASGLGLDVEAEEDEATTRRSRALSSTSLASFVTSSFVAELSGQNRSFSVRCRATSLAAVAGRPPGRRQKDPEWMLEYGAAVDRYLETAGRSISELSRRRGR